MQWFIFGQTQVEVHATVTVLAAAGYRNYSFAPGTINIRIEDQTEEVLYIKSSKYVKF